MLMEIKATYTVSVTRTEPEPYHRVLKCIACRRPLGDVLEAGGRTYLKLAIDQSIPKDGELVECPICHTKRRFVSCRTLEAT